MQDHPTYKLPTCTNGCMYLDPLADSILTCLDQGRIWGHSLRVLQITKNRAEFIIYRLISYKKDRICTHCAQRACWGWRQGGLRAQVTMRLERGTNGCHSTAINVSKLCLTQGSHILPKVLQCFMGCKGNYHVH